MRFITGVAVLVIAVAIAGGVYFFGGFFDVSAANGGNPVIEWSLTQVREASMDKHAQAPPLPAWFTSLRPCQAGAREFTEEGCVSCYGAPGVKPAQVRARHKPAPAGSQRGRRGR